MTAFVETECLSKPKMEKYQTKCMKLNIQNECKNSLVDLNIEELNRIRKDKRIPI